VLSVSCHDAFLPTPRGNLYVRHWKIAAGSAPKPPIVLLHDSLGCVALWRDFPQDLALATGCSVIAYDRLGFGQSSTHPGVLGPDFVAEEARNGFAQVMEQLALERFVVLGHSIGGGMGIIIAETYPDRCCALITESAQTFVEDRTIQGIRAARMAFSSGEQMQRLAKYHADKAPWVLGAWVNTWLSPEFSQWHLDAHIPRIQCPILAIHGTQDEYGSTAHPQRLAALATAPVTLVCLPDCGHIPHREHRPVVLKAIRDFLEVLQ